MKTAWMILVALALVGCTTTKPKPAPLTQADIISMVKAGMGDEEIMRRIDATHTVFRLGSDEVVMLRKEGVSDRVVNYMLDSYARAMAAEEQRRRNQPKVSIGLGYSYWGR